MRPFSWAGVALGEFDALAVRRDCYGPVVCRLDRAFEGLERDGLAVDQERLARGRLKSGEPANEFAAAGVRGELREDDHFGADGNHLAENFEELGAVLQLAAVGSFALGADEKHGGGGKPGGAGPDDAGGGRRWPFRWRRR